MVHRVHFSCFSVFVRRSGKKLAGKYEKLLFRTHFQTGVNGREMFTVKHNPGSSSVLFNWKSKIALILWVTCSFFIVSVCRHLSQMMWSEFSMLLRMGSSFCTLSSCQFSPFLPGFLRACVPLRGSQRGSQTLLYSKLTIEMGQTMGILG